MIRQLFAPLKTRGRHASLLIAAPVFLSALAFGPGLTPVEAQSKLPKRPKIEDCKKLIDLARKARSLGKYDAAVAIYRRASDIAPSKKLSQSIWNEAGGVMELQKKYKKALRIYSQNRLGKQEVLLCMKLKLYKKALATAKLYNLTKYEGRVLLKLGKSTEALKVFRLGLHRYDEAKALQSLKFPAKAADIFEAIKSYRAAAEAYALAKNRSKSVAMWKKTKSLYEKSLVRRINDIRKMRKAYAEKRKASSKQYDDDLRILRLKLAQTYKKAADTYEKLAAAERALGNKGLSKKFLKQVLNFLRLYYSAFTDNKKDKYGVDTLNSSGYLERVGALKKQVG